MDPKHWIMALHIFLGEDEVVVADGVAEARDYINRNQRRKNRLVLNLDSALDLNNYEPIEASNAASRERYRYRNIFTLIF